MYHYPGLVPLVAEKKATPQLVEVEILSEKQRVANAITGITCTSVDEPPAQ